MRIVRNASNAEPEGSLLVATNPFTPTFGVVPPYMAGRESLVEELSCAFANGLGDPNLCTIVSGARGTGKTAFLAFMAGEAESQGWVVAKTTAAEGMLDDILQQAAWNAQHFLDGAAGRKLKGVSVGQIISLEWENEPLAKGNWRTQMNRLLDQLKEHEIGLLVTVDEVKVTIEEMKQLVRVYQHFVTEGRKVALLMAGLPHNVSQLLRDDDISFLRRSRKHTLGRISDAEIGNAFRLTVEEADKEMAPDALDMAVEAIDGFPYMMQLVGYYACSESHNSTVIGEDAARRGIDRAKRDMVEGVLEYTYLDLSSGDKRFLRAMLGTQKDVSLARIAQEMGVKSNYASQYKKRLLEQGVIGECYKGYVRFDMPVFKEYFAERLAEEEGLNV